MTLRHFQIFLTVCRRQSITAAAEELNMKYGILYGVSVGPGDPELMTVKAVRILERCPVVAAPRTAGEKTLALDIASGAADLTGKTILNLEFAMTGTAASRR